VWDGVVAKDGADVTGIEPVCGKTLFVGEGS